MKNLILILFIFSVIGCKTEGDINTENYIDLVYHKDKSDNIVLSHIYTDIKDSQDSVGVFINNHSPRFAYFFQT